jgi:hypothetical protein
MGRRTEAQLALLVIGLIVWGYGQRVDDERLRWIGIAFFAVATVLRFAKRRPREEDGPS